MGSSLEYGNLQPPHNEEMETNIKKLKSVYAISKLKATNYLIELNKKYKFIKSNTHLLDLGSYPGGWSQVAVKLITRGKILSVDIRDMEPIKNVKFLKCNFLEEEAKSKILEFFGDF